MEFHYDDAGTLIGQTVTREPEFNADEVNLLLAHARAVSDIGTHGQPLSEAMDPQASRDVPGGWHYEAPENPSIDYAQLELSRKQDAYFEKHKDKKLTEAQKRSMNWRVKRVDG